MPALLTRPLSVSPDSAARTRVPPPARGFVGDVEYQWGKIRTELAFQAIGIGLLADAAEHPKSAIQQQLCRGPADTVTRR